MKSVHKNHKILSLPDGMYSIFQKIIIVQRIKLIDVNNRLNTNCPSRCKQAASNTISSNNFIL